MNKRAITKKMNNKVNIGIEILRMILSFWILLVHCFRVRNKIQRKIIFIMRFHVPCFIIISFYFYYKVIFKPDINKIKQRFLRLLIPYLVWPFIIIVIKTTINLFAKGEFDRKIIIKNLIYQFVFGRKILPVFWFQFSIIILTLIVTIISLIFKTEFLFIIQILAILEYYLQYSLKYYYFLKNYKTFISNSLGMALEMIPFTASGMTCGYYSLINLLKNRKKKSIIFGLIFFIFIFFSKRDVMMEPKKFFLYPGIILNIGGIFLFIIFGLIPFELIKNKVLIIILRQITKYTGGIYYLHWVIRDCLKVYILLIRKRSFLGCIIIYMFCYFICLIGNFIFSNTKLKFLFN